MKNIETLEEFEQILGLDKCLIFVAASWSGQSTEGQEKVRKWSQGKDTEIFVLNVDNELFWGWFVEQEKKSGLQVAAGGHGSLLGAKHGKVTNSLIPHRLSLEELTQKVESFFFNHENHPNPAAG